SVAAPIAMLGYATVDAGFDLDLTRYVDRRKQTQLLRVDREWASDNGLSTTAWTAPQYVYVTQRPVIWPIVTVTIGSSDFSLAWSDGKRHTVPKWCGDGGFGPIEIQPDGSERMSCVTYTELSTVKKGSTADLSFAQLLPDGRFRTGADQISNTLTQRESWPLPLLVAAIDPASEADLVGLDRAVTSGTYPSGDSTAVLHGQERMVPTMVAASTPVDDRVTTSVEQVSLPDTMNIWAQRWTNTAGQQAPAAVLRLPGVPVGSATHSERDGYAAMVASEPDSGFLAFAGGSDLVQPGPVDLDNTGGTLRPRPFDGTYPAISVDFGDPSLPVSPVFSGDTMFRHTGFLEEEMTSSTAATTGAELQMVAVYDPTRVTGLSGLGAVPLETYVSPRLVGADATNRALLGGAPLAPGTNVAGFAAAPPSLLVPLNAIAFMKLPRPISAIRVRVAGVTGVDPVSRERVRLAAQQIQAATGLDVDITVGSSPSPQTIDLPAGKYGRPALSLSEGWTRKGVAVAVIRAVDRKSVVLFVLILVVCTLFLANAVTAAVRDRRRELAVLACLGWPRRRLAALVVGEVAVIGLVAGLLSAAAALPVADAAGVRLGATHALLAVPIAILVALVAAAVPAWRGSRVRAAAAVEPGTSGIRRSRRFGRRRSVAGIALANLTRKPGRTVLGALSLAIGVAAVTVLAAVTWAFHGAVTGSLLGDAISLQVRGADEVAVAATIVLGLVAIGDLLYLNVRERAAELAALRAVGWSEPTLGRLVAVEGVGIGAIGAVLGAAAGVLAASVFAGGYTPRLAWIAAGAAAAGIVLVAVAAVVPALAQRRLPASALLAEE
ncbi:MAG TPA: FtsX-like permease family protein, partial [Micromonosporaceae bacterium]|nr:FtsX-like permease family protein [Micromonosporaceae bacterium]